MPGRRLPPLAAGRVSGDNGDEHDRRHDHSGSSSDSDEDDIDERVMAPIGLAGMTEADEVAPAHSRKDLVPIYDINHTRLSSHFLFNVKYNVMRHSKGSEANVRVNSLLEHIVATTDSPCSSLLYPEGQLFPRIFWAADNDSILGAMPSFMLNCNRSKFPLLASLADHTFVRIRDGCLLTARENGYWHYLFDLKLNTALCNASSKMVFKRGLEFLLEQGNGDRSAPQSDRSSQETSLPMDESEATRRVKELASLLKKGPWHYFLTLTCNDMHTPGVRVITRAMESYAHSQNVSRWSHNAMSDFTVSFLPFLLRAWQRFIRLFLEELVMRNDTILGKVKHMFYRFEFQVCFLCSLLNNYELLFIT